MIFPVSLRRVGNPETNVAVHHVDIQTIAAGAAGIGPLAVPAAAAEHGCRAHGFSRAHVPIRASEVADVSRQAPDSVYGHVIGKIFYNYRAGTAPARGQE